MNLQEVDIFIEEQTKIIQPLYNRILICQWMSATTGEKEWGGKHEEALNEYYKYCSDQDIFRLILSYRKQAGLDQLQHRQLEYLYNIMVKNQLDRATLTETVKMEQDLRSTFNTYRPSLEGKQVTNNDLLNILKHSQDSGERKRAWLASKQIGKKIEHQLLTLVRKRNEAAQALGYRNFFEMSLETEELEMEHVFGILHSLKELSDVPFERVKAEMDDELCRKLGVTRDELRPWHYSDPFFQECPSVKGIDADAAYKDKNLEQVAIETFQAMGLDISDILAKSDLYPRENKNPFGFCTNIDREGDIRILVNLDNSQFWATALLHEFGHAVNFKYIERDLPFILRFHSHTLTTEAIALFFGRMNKLATWQERFLGIPRDQIQESMPSIKTMLQRQMLVSTRWMMTFTFFERELYENPDQDLNKLWWDLVQQIQFLHPPEDVHYPDWASKMHFSLAPVSYHNYLLGELTASQLQCYMEREISSDLFTPDVGQYLKQEFFYPGATLHWNEKIKSATGEYLNPQYFVKQFLES